MARIGHSGHSEFVSSLPLCAPSSHLELTDFAWINNEVYEDGQQLQDSSQIRVMSGSKVQIRITAPDGKIYYANSGETIDITYLAVVEDE